MAYRRSLDGKRRPVLTHHSSPRRLGASTVRVERISSQSSPNLQEFAIATDSSPSRGRRWLIVAICFAAVLAIGFRIQAVRSKRASVTRAADAAQASIPNSVVALGSIVPGDAVIHLNAPASSGEARLQTLTVKVNDPVFKGQVVGTLDSIERLNAAVSIAASEVVQKQASLERVKAGNSGFAIGAQRATLERLKADAVRQEADAKRSKVLYDQGIMSDSDYESHIDTYNQAEEAVHQAEQTLQQVSEVRPVDVAVSQADLLNAQASLKSARADVEQALIRAPQAGRILHIYTWPGERIATDQGVLDMAATDQIYVDAEVYETDIARVRLGQPVTVTGTALPEALHGRVAVIENSVGRQQIVNTDPAANTDARVTIVRVLLDNEAEMPAERLINLQVRVEFRP